MISLFPNETSVPRRRRRIALLIVLIMQTVFAILCAWRPAPGTAAESEAGGLLKHAATSERDFPRYELPAYNLANGHSLSLPLRVSRDPTVYAWVCSRHPDACLPDGTHPTALYPPGFSIFAAGIYKVFGRSVVAVIGVQYLLLLLLFVVFEILAARLLDGVGYAFAMGIAATYPFLAMYAVLFSTEHLHNVLYMGALAVMMLMKPGWRRGTLFGLLFACATLVRPYSLLVFPILWIWPSIWRAAKAAWRERLLMGLAFVIPMALWAARNAYWFGRFIPLTTLGPGLVLMHTTLTWEAPSYTPGSGDRYYDGLAASIGEPDVTSYNAQKRLGEMAMERIKEHPGRLAATVVKNVPKLWISLGSDSGRSRYWPLLVLYLGGLWVLGVIGCWLQRHDGRWHLLLLAIGLYWAFLLYTPGDARRTSAIRLPMLLAAGSAASALVEWGRKRKAAAHADADAA